MNIANENGIAGIAHRIPLALFLSYIMACAAYLSGKTWVKTIISLFPQHYNLIFFIST